MHPASAGVGGQDEERPTEIDHLDRTPIAQVPAPAGASVGSDIWPRSDTLKAATDIGAAYNAVWWIYKVTL